MRPSSLTFPERVRRVHHRSPFKQEQALSPKACHQHTAVDEWTAPNVHFPPHTFPLSSPPSGLWLSVHFTLPAFPFLQVFENTHTHTHTHAHNHAYTPTHTHTHTHA